MLRHWRSRRGAFEFFIRSAPASLSTALVAFPCMSLIPFAPFSIFFTLLTSPLPNALTSYYSHPMKNVKTLLLLTSLLFATLAYGQSPKSAAVAAATATAAAQQSSASGTPSTPPTIASAIDREISIIEKEIVETA